MAVTTSSLRQALRRLPKVDLHRHLEGSLRLATMAELVRSEGLELPADEASLRSRVQVMPGEERTALGFLSKFEPLRQFYRSPETIARLTREAIEDAAADGVRYLEIRFTPAALARARHYPLAEVMDWVCEAATQEAGLRGLKVGLIASINRHEPLEVAEEVARRSAERRLRGIVGLDLAGNEIKFQADPFSPIFATAKQEGLGITVHAGEWSGPEAVRHALEVMGADRVGHGVRVLEDAKVTALARERRTVFEVCLSSNLHSGVVRRADEHPLPSMIEAGLQVTLNTDDPGVSDTCLTDEYALAIDSLGLSLESLKGLILAGAQGAFLPPKEKASLEADLQAELLRIP